MLQTKQVEAFVLHITVQIFIRKKLKLLIFWHSNSEQVALRDSKAEQLAFRNAFSGKFWDNLLIPKGQLKNVWTLSSLVEFYQAPKDSPQYPRTPKSWTFSVGLLTKQLIVPTALVVFLLIFVLVANFFFYWCLLFLLLFGFFFHLLVSLFTQILNWVVLFENF